MAFAGSGSLPRWIRAWIACLLTGCLLGALSGCASQSVSPDQRYQTQEASFQLIDEGRQLSDRGERLLALERFNRAAQRYESPAAFFEMGRMFESAGKLEEAATAYQEALQLAPDFQEAQFAMLALGYVPPGYEPTEADRQLALQWAAEHPAPASEVPFDEAGETLVASLGEAEIEAQRMPTQAELRSILFGPQPAEATLPEATGAAFPTSQDIILGSYEYHYRKAEQFRGREEYQKAAEEYGRAIEADTGQIQARLDLGDMMLRMERYPRARFHYEQAMEDFPESPKPFFKMGLYYYTLKQQDMARDYYRQALDRDAGYVEAYNNLAVLLMEQKKYDDAALLLDELIAMEPLYSNAYLNRGIIASDIEGDNENALKLFRKYVDLRGARADQFRRWIAEIEQEQP